MSATDPDHDDRCSAVAATATALPQHRSGQRELVRGLAAMGELGAETRRLERFFARVGVEERFLALPIERYRDLDGLESRSRVWCEVATVLGERAVRAALGEAGVAAEDVGTLLTTTVTGLSVPTLDARLMNRIPFAPDLKRVPMFGLGCVGGVAGVARAADYLRGHPGELAVLLSVELCSLTLQKTDLSVANIISMGLFGDGAAAVLLAGADHPLARRARPVVVDSRSVFFRDTERMMGWDFVDDGFKVVLSPEVPTVAREALPPAVDRFLGDHGLARDDVGAWVTHPGGPKVMEALAEGLGLDAAALRPAREGLAEVGNLSSSSVLFLLDRYRRGDAPAAGTHGLMIAMGPAFCAELVLLRW